MPTKSVNGAERLSINTESSCEEVIALIFGKALKKVQPDALKLNSPFVKSCFLHLVYDFSRFMCDFFRYNLILEIYYLDNCI